MNKKMWQSFYESDRDNYPTDFAKFCSEFIPPGSRVVDLGCGNGRDTYYFAEKGHKVQGVDYATMPKDYQKATFLPFNLSQIIHNGCGWDVIYSRFFLHAITETDVKRLVMWSRGLFMAEFRCVGDKPKLYADHKRTFINPEKLINMMIHLGYEIIYFYKGNNLASYKDENPLVGRIVAKR